ncbi:PCMD domain-containing protein [Flammeovirga kamogawensis]|uniref:PCMD domain-containing protein n=1 Tax=Flammeovirga kamogawensis TaxID=373891 RepID=A0ABX8H0H0_9BACT|nr:PCMD domain-containing protein [Flammeovirga kamogawensis]MBB6462215.1 hypothetical protein [Flammeovirga kamogawensis]QWG09384.1 PCMD domain-containing protein [Flammeovirga kamogawensis]TRX64902.1 hypothetical protein EO216_20430 [Flammeovirga kamogawensis]
MIKKQISTSILFFLLLTSCINNDVPYPYTFGEILSFQLEEQEGAAIISVDEQTIEVRVPYGTDKSHLSILDIEVTEGAVLTPPINQVSDFTDDVFFNVAIYEDFIWKVNVIESDFDAIISSFVIEGQVSSEIDIIAKVVNVEIPSYMDKSNLVVDTLTYIPDEVMVYPAINELTDFSEVVTLNFEGIEWSINVNYVNEGIEKIGDQVLYSDFNTWYYGGRDPEESDENRKFFIPGTSFSSTPWRTGDVGAADLIISTGVRTVYPYPSAENYEYTVLKTTSMLGVIAAGSLYTGKIKGSGIATVTTDFGIPFTDRPKSFKTSIQYLPKEYGNGLDNCDIYVLLQVREGEGENTKHYRLATGWFRSATIMNDFEEIEIPLLYGNHNDLKPYMMPSTNNNEMPEHGFADISSTPTHIIVVYSSSYDGANFNGGIGSELRVKEFELNY